jgi:hypothetical protein
LAGDRVVVGHGVEYRAFGFGVVSDQLVRRDGLEWNQQDNYGCNTKK